MVECPKIRSGKGAHIERDRDRPYMIWVCCPYCGKKNFRIWDTTKISCMPYKCKGSNCKMEFEVNYG